MSDNITAPAAGAILATDEIGGVHFPRTKISVGADGSAVDVSTDNPLPVSILDAVPVTGTFWQATQPVSGTVAVTGALTDIQLRAAPVPVSGTVTATVTGVATATKQDELIAAVANQATASSWFAITPADTNLSTVPDAIYVGGAGNVVARGSNGVDATFSANAGAVLPIRPTQIRASSTATGIVGLVN